MRVDGKWKEEAQIEKQSGQGEEGEECVELSDSRRHKDSLNV